MMDAHNVQTHLLSPEDRVLLAKALAMAASRLEACGRSYPRTAKAHEVVAARMRALRRRLQAGAAQ